jgi:hypothetical protein
LLYGPHVRSIRSPEALILGVVVALALLASAPVHAQTGSPLARLFGVAPDSPRDELTELARRSGADCRAAAPLRSGSPPRTAVPVVCAVPPVVAPVAMNATYWFEDDVLDRAFMLGTLVSPEIANYRKRFDVLQEWVSRALGAPSQPLQLPPDWGSGRPPPDRQQMEQLLAGRARLSLVWERPEATVELWLAGENGRLVLALGLRRKANGIRCNPAVVTQAMFDLFPPASPGARARSAETLAACHVTRAFGALLSTLENDDVPGVQVQALRALDNLGHAPSRTDLERLGREGEPALAAAAREILKRPRPSAPATPLRRPPPTQIAKRAAEEGSVQEGPVQEGPVQEGPVQEGPVQEGPAEAALGPARHLAPRAPAQPARAAAAPIAAMPPKTAPAAPSGPVPGTPLAIGASTVAGAAFMRNLGLLGGQQLSGATPQLLLGSAGAVIGFGTSWGLARFGFRPTMEQAAWFTNTTAWGTLVGLGTWNLSGPDSPKLRYGALVVGEAAGMGLGVWSSRRWQWTAPQIVLSDSFLLGAGLTALGFDLMREPHPHLRLRDTIGMPIVMVAGAIASRTMSPTDNDIKLMTASALGGAWTGGLLAAGVLHTSFLDSRQSWGGVAAGLGTGYLAGAALGAVSEADGSSLLLAGGGMLAGNVLGLGLHTSIQGFSHANGPGVTFTPDEVRGRALTAGLGGLVLGGAAYAYAPYLRPGPSATSMTVSGILYGAGTWWLASTASYHGQPITEIDDAKLSGGALTGAALGGITGLVTSRWFAPDGQAQGTAAGAAGLGMSAGLGLAKLTTDTKGTPDAVGVLLGTGAGLGAGAFTAGHVRLRAPDVGAGFVGLAEGALAGTLIPTLRWDTWQDSRTTAGSTLLGMSLGGGVGVATAHLTGASSAEVGVTTVAGLLGLGMGSGAGFMLPCDEFKGCTSRAPRVGTLVGPLALMGGAMALEPTLHLASGLGPNAGKLAFLGSTFGFADGLMLAGALDRGGTVSGTPARQIWGGILLGTSTEVGAGLVVSKFVTLRDGDALFLASGKVTGGLFGLGAALELRDQTGAADTLATLTGSLAGLGAAAVAQAYTPLDGTDGAAAFTGSAYGALVGALIPTLDEPRWQGLDRRKPGGGLLLGLSGGAIGGAALSHAADASPRTVGLAALGGADGLISGLGLGLLIGDEDKSQAERFGLVTGTAAGLAIGALAWPRLTMDNGGRTFTFASTGLGGWMGVWIPTLGHANFNEVSPRKTWGGLLTGTGLSSIGASLLAPVIKPDPDLVTNALGVDALWTGAGAGAGALLSTRDDAPVWGMLGAGTVGLLLGGALHRSIELEAADAPLLGLAGGEGLWLGAWVPNLLHENETVPERQRVGALALGGFGALGLTTVVSSAFAIKPDPDVIWDAAGLDALWTGAGAGVGALVSPSENAPIWGMLGAGVAGLGVGGALHQSIELDEADAPLLTLAGVEGLWFGAWLPSLIYKPTGFSDRQEMGGLAAGGLGALGLATIASGALEITPARSGYSAMGSAMGASLAGGLVLMSPSLHDRAGVGLMLGGTAAGLVAGAAFTPRLALEPTSSVLGAAAAGGTLGLSEALLFAWSGRASGSDQYAGAALLGGSIGAGLGIATTATASDSHSSAPAAAGFAAWGAWMGSFTGTLVRNDPHEVVMGGLIGANLGFLGGYALLRSDLVEPRDFGWLSLFGAIGTLAGAGVGAPFNDSNTTFPLRAGLAAGPLVGMLGGSFFLPRLRKVRTSGNAAPLQTSFATFRSRRSRALRGFSGGVPGHLMLSSEILEAADGPGRSHPLRRLAQIVEITDWAPLVGALPAPAETGPPPMLFGLTGRWK